MLRAGVVSRSTRSDRQRIGPLAFDLLKNGEFLVNTSTECCSKLKSASRRGLALGNDPLDRQLAILASPRWVIPLNVGGWLILAIGGGWLAWTLLS